MKHLITCGNAPLFIVILNMICSLVKHSSYDSTILKSPINQAASKAMLTQTIRLIFKRIEFDLDCTSSSSAANKEVTLAERTSNAFFLGIDSSKPKFGDVSNRFIAMTPPYSWQTQVYQTSLSRDVTDDQMSLSYGLEANKEVDFLDCTRNFWLLFFIKCRSCHNYTFD